MCQQCVDSVKMFVLRGNWSAGRGIGEFWSKIIFFKKKKNLWHTWHTPILA
jgi:hypothetical protein